MQEDTKGGKPLKQAYRADFVCFEKIRGFPKTSAFGKATLNLYEKADFRPLFRKLFPKLTEFWEKLIIVEIKAVHKFTSELFVHSSVSVRVRPWLF
jgi:hypothetical protein